MYSELREHHSRGIAFKITQIIRDAVDPYTCLPYYEFKSRVIEAEKGNVRSNDYYYNLFELKVKKTLT